MGVYKVCGTAQAGIVNSKPNIPAGEYLCGGQLAEEQPSSHPERSHNPRKGTDAIGSRRTLPPDLVVGKLHL